MNLNTLGWARYSPAAHADNSYGRVALVQRDRLLVWTADGEVAASLSGPLRQHPEQAPSVGDWVVLRDASVVVDVLPRRTKLSRKEPGKAPREQVLAANMDVLFVVSGLDRDYNPRRLERYLVFAYESGARPVIVLNKADLCPDIDPVLQESQRRAPGVPIIAVSALEQSGLEVLARQVEHGETAALIGSSGAGKSTIVNALLGYGRQHTTLVRESDQKGRHTTTQRELIQMPGGWLLMDLPGLRELQLWADPEGIDDAFAEIAELAAQCRFRDCTHQHEPGCAVFAAELDPARLRSYQKLRRELEHLQRETGIHHAREMRKKWNALERDIRRNHPKRKN